MRQPYAKRMLLGDIFFNIIAVTVIGIFVLIAGMFVTSRVYLLHHNYNVLKLERENEVWLLVQCQDDTFYHSMKHHSTLCDELAAKQEDSILLLSLQKVAQQTYICGDQPCYLLAQSFFEWLTGKGFLFLILIMIFFLITPTMFIGLWHTFSRFSSTASRRNRHSQDHSLYFEPLDQTNYFAITSKNKQV